MEEWDQPLEEAGEFTSRSDVSSPSADAGWKDELNLAEFPIAALTDRIPDGQTTLVPGLVATEKVSMLWMVVAYIVLTFGEVLLYPTALQLAFTAAPKSMKGFVTAVFLLTNTLGNFINTFWTTTYGGSFNDKPEDRGSLAPGRFFALTALMAVGAGLAFIYVGRRFQRENEFEANGGVA